MTAARVITMSALNDEEDNPPLQPPRLTLMSTPDERDTRNTITMPPPSELETKTENEAPDPARVPALRPPPADEWDTAFLREDDSVFSNAVRMVAKAGRLMAEERQERRSTEDMAASRHAEQLAQGAKIIQAVDRADQNSSRNYELLRVEIGHLKASDLKQDQRLKDGDRRFEEIEQSIVDLKSELVQRLATLEAEIAKAKADGPGPAPTAAT